MRHRLLSLALLTAVVAAAVPAVAAAEDYDVTIRRTAHGIPHIEAKDFASLGYGYGYSFAQDNLCVMADQYVTVRGERSKYFGPDGSWQLRGNGTTNNNLNSDFFFKRIIKRGTVERLMNQPPPLGPRQEVKDAVRGYVAGYNRYLEDTGVDNLPDPACRGQAWVKPIEEIDAYRRFYQLALLASGDVAIDGIGGAQPPTPGVAAPALPVPKDAAARLKKGWDLGIGSNAVALGRDQTDNGKGMLLGNPHFPWDGTERFYQAHATIPGKLDVQGGALFGVPVVLIGNTRSFAWSHTVSTAFRFTPFELTLVPGDPTSYLVDGKPEKMQSDDLTVDVKQPDGSVKPVTRTLYTTRWGPMMTSLLGLPIFPWTPAKAFAMGDANADNFRYLNHFLETDMAQSVREYDQIERRNQGIPWVNSIAADASGEAYYADIGVVPHVTNAEAQQCNTAVGTATFAALGLPVLDGSRSACAWGHDPDAVQPGTFGPNEHLPSMIRTDYAMNSNDSYWLGNLKQRLEGFPRIVGDERTERSLRQRLGLIMVDGTKFSQRSLQDMVFNDRQYAGEMWRDPLVQVCDGMGPQYAAACQALRAWNLRDDTDSRGALLFRRIAERLLANAPPWSKPFDVNDPAHTPSGLNTADPRVATAIAQAVQELQGLQIPLDAPLGSVQTEDRNGERLPIPGGPGVDGVFNAINVDAADLKPKVGYDSVPHGSSYVQVVQFTNGGCPVVPKTILTYSQSTNRESPWYSDQTRMFGKKQWNDMPFCHDDVVRDTISELHLSSRSHDVAQTCPDRFAVRAGVKGRRVRFSATAEVFRVGSRGVHRVARGRRSYSTRRDGVYFARMRRGTQSRRIPFAVRHGRPRLLRAFEQVVPCGPLRRLKLTGPSFGHAGLGVAFRLGERARVAVKITRNGKTIRRVSGTRRPGVEHHLRIRGKRGTYRVRLTAVGPTGTVRSTVWALRH